MNPETKLCTCWLAVLIAVFTLLSSCSKRDPVGPEGTTGSVVIRISFEEALGVAQSSLQKYECRKGEISKGEVSESRTGPTLKGSMRLGDRAKTGSLSKSQGDISSVMVIIVGPGMETMEQNLSVDLANTQASGTIEGIPAGPNRTVRVELRDSFGQFLYYGETQVTIEANRTAEAYIAVSVAILVSEPNSSTVWTLGQQDVTITWNPGGLGGSVAIDLYKASSRVASIVSSTSNDGSYGSWDVPASLSPDDDYRVRVYKDASHYDYSDYFTIGGSIEVTEPTSATIWTLGENNVDITWNTGGLGGYVEIALYKGSSSVATISSSTSNDGSYGSWDVPTSLASDNDYRIRVYKDASNYDYSEYFSIESEVLKWRYQTGDVVWSSPAIASDGTIYVGSRDAYLYAINPDGTLRWRYRTGGDVDSSPAIGSDGTIYVGSYDNYLYAINPDGTLRWQYMTTGKVRSSPAIGTGGIAYVGSDDNCFYAIDQNGTLVWRYITGADVFGAPAIGTDGTIYLSSTDNNLYTIGTNGTLRWRYQTGGNIASSPAVGSDGSIYVGSNDGYLYAIRSNGTLQWRSGTGGIVLSSPAIGAGGTIYVGSRDAYLYAINPDGTLRWRYRTGDDVDSSPAIGSDGTIYVGSYDNYLYAINPDGTLRWQYQTGGDVRSSPAIGSDGTIYVGSYDGYIYALKSDSYGLANSPWPKFHHDNRNTGRSGGP